MHDAPHSHGKILHFKTKQNIHFILSLLLRSNYRLPLTIRRTVPFLSQGVPCGKGQMSITP